MGWDLFRSSHGGIPSGVSGKVESKPAKHLQQRAGPGGQFLPPFRERRPGRRAFSISTRCSPLYPLRQAELSGDPQAPRNSSSTSMSQPGWVPGRPLPMLRWISRRPATMPTRTSLSVANLGRAETYAEFQDESTFQQAFLQVMADGDMQGGACLPFDPHLPASQRISTGMTRNSKLLWEMTAKYGVPYFSNFINSGHGSGRRQKHVLPAADRQSGTAQTGEGAVRFESLTGPSIGVITINMPRIGLSLRYGRGVSWGGCEIDGHGQRELLKSRERCWRNSPTGTSIPIRNTSNT